ncbi:MAG: hypothetical protein ACRDYE_13465 [Acidimicrobiales bacterium]
MQPVGDQAEEGGAGTTTSTGSGGPRPAGRGGAPLHAAVIGSYLALAVVLWWRVWITGHPATTITSPWGDPSQEVWWLQWLPWAIRHGHDPFFTHAMNAGMGGVNGLANPSVLLPALVAAPITLVSGPVFSFNVMATVTPAFSGWCMFVLCRRLTSFVPGQILAGALWGFSPFVVTNLPLGHLNLVTGYFPPLAALVLVNLVDGRRRGRGAPARASHRRSPRREGVELGLALAALIISQFLVGTEMLIDAALLGSIAALTAVIVIPGRLWAARARIATGLAVGGAASAIVLAYPSWYATAGPATVTGDVWRNNGLGLDGSTVLQPGPLVHTSGVLTALVGYFGPSGPSYLYLGIPLVAFLALSSLVWYRRPLAWVLVATGTAAWTFALGQPLTGPLRPWGVLRRVPIFQKVQPQRFGDFVMLAAAVLLAISLDGWRRALSDRRSWRDRHPWLPPAVLAAVGVAVLVPIASTYTVFVEHPRAAPAWYLTSARSLPPSTRVLTVPVPDLFPTSAMEWQAEDDFRFDIIGGYAVVPGRDGHTDSLRAPFGGPTKTVQDLSFGEVDLPSTPNAQTLGVRRQLLRWGVDDVVVSAPTLHPAFASSYFTAVMGRPPAFVQEAWVWVGLGTSPPRPLTAGVWQACTAAARRSTDPMAGPNCVMRHTPR